MLLKRDLSASVHDAGSALLSSVAEERLIGASGSC
jgi:hypothetical protein